MQQLNNSAVSGGAAPSPGITILVDSTKAPPARLERLLLKQYAGTACFLAGALCVPCCCVSPGLQACVLQSLIVFEYSAA